ncbi:uncharacterized protein LOC117177083 [Belonocnema kinseyi]|uniref:uncharacterized protein LOC117177083 n=1 Tax=Belonocnema kinseyi TaxID=2817044 RepID=UPI00143E0379|nr:uncharacterized protein LOC117177083 [Belonocnema kinseyi]
MEEFCPLCMKRGLKKKMKAIQINLEEAVWMCESEKCIWPMEYKELEYIPRKIGESWSCYWHNYKPKRSEVTESQSGWQFFVTPPYTPKTVVSPAASSDTSTHSSNGISRLYNAYSKEPVDSCSSKDTTTSNSTTDHIEDTEKNNILVLENSISDLLPTQNDNDLIDVNNTADLNQFTLDRPEISPLESKKLEAGTRVNVQRNSDSGRVSAGPKSLDTGVPIIVKIEKGNLVSIKSINNNRQLPRNESVLKPKPQVAYERVISNTTLTKRISSENPVQNSSPQTPGLLNKKENLQSNNSIKHYDKISDSSSVEIRTVNIEGLPPVMLRYEVPTFLQETNGAEIKERFGEKSEPELVVSKKIEVEKSIPPLSKKTLMAGKMYEKFSFSELRKAKNMQKNSADKVQVSNSSENALKVKKSVFVIKEVNSDFEAYISKPSLEVPPSSMEQILPETTESVIDTSYNTESLALTNSKTVDRNASLDSDHSKDNVISDLDSFLNDYIEENEVINMNENMSGLPNVDDDWLSSLLT